MTNKIVHGLTIYAGLIVGQILATAWGEKNWSKCWNTLLDQAVAVATTVALL